MPIGSVARGFDVNATYTSSLYGKDRIGHTTPDAEISEEYAAQFAPTLNRGALLAMDYQSPQVRPNEFVLPRRKVAAMNATMSKAGDTSRVSNKYNAATVR